MFFRSKAGKTNPGSGSPAPVQPGDRASEPTAPAAATITQAAATAAQTVANPKAEPLPAARVQPSAAAGGTSADAEARKRQGANLSWRIAAAFGNIVTVFMRSPQHRHLTLQAIEETVVPAVLTRQFYLTQAQSNDNGITAPIGVVLWASVSNDIDQRLCANLATPLRLTTNDWKSGEHLWLMEAIGEPKVVSAMLQQLQKSAWGGRTIKMRAKDSSGKIVVRSLTAKPDAAPTT